VCVCVCVVCMSVRVYACVLDGEEHERKPKQDVHESGSARV
jgi:hypothetical protein